MRTNGHGSRAQAGRARRESILDASLECFLDYGVGATTVDQILERSGASVGSFYHQFDGKEAVAAALYLETLSAYQGGFLEELHGHRSARDGIEGAVRYHLRWLSGDPKRACYLTHCREPEVAQRSETDIQALNRVFFDQVLGWLAQCARDGDIKRMPLHLYYPVWMGPAGEFTRLWLSGSRNTRHLADATTVLPAAAWDALRTRPTRR